MKKLMIIAAVALAAVSAQASKFSWGFYSENFCDEGGSGDLTGYSAYLVSAADWAGVNPAQADTVGAALATAIASTPIDDELGGFDSDGYYYEYGPKDVFNSTAAVDDAQDYYIVFDNGEKYFATAVTGDILADDDNRQGATPFYDDALALDTGDFTSYGSTPGPGPDPTPEPTSGLLMLVGLAGLALKRKRA